MKNNKTYILGISAYYHDSAAALLENGNIIAAAQEERFTRKKHDPSFPSKAVEYCLKEAGVEPGDLDVVAFYDKPFVKFERLLETYLAYAPSGIWSFIQAMPPWIKKKLFMKEHIKSELGYQGRIIFPEHHHSHAASAFYPSPFEEAAILTVDGVGEWATVTLGKGRGNRIELFEEIRFPHSLGLLYSAFTYYCGFKVNSGEYKLMGLAPYGEPVYAQIILDELIDLKPDGSFKLNMKYFNYCAGLTMTNRKFHKLFGGPPRKKEAEVEQRHMDLARSVQVVTESVVMKMARHLYDTTSCRNLCMAGGVALNCVSNGKVLREGPFEKIWIQPASSDAGGALGAALVAWHEYLGNVRHATKTRDSQKASLLGPDFSDEEVERYLKENGIPYTRMGKEDLYSRVASLIAAENVIGWFQGRMEFGPRALGSRSILGDPRSEKMQSVINRKIKFRESFRPFAPSILAENAKEYFGLDSESPYMLIVSPVAEEKRVPMKNDSLSRGMEKLKEKRSEVPAITHVDYSARVQTVKREDNPDYYALIEKFSELHGCPLVINTSFNVRGEPIVCTPDDAYRCFMRTNMDYLVMGSFVIDKKQQDPARLRLEEVFEFELD
ncbi:MAG TPA: carbamoyltransferase [Candidatus Omnitrophota bacterium]|nr:carbamoyltransferase [Candidatus Omnitrophota bacterium]